MNSYTQFTISILLAYKINVQFIILHKHKSFSLALLSGIKISTYTFSFLKGELTKESSQKY